MTRPALLDVNVLVALFDPDHVHHELAHDWFAQNHTNGWATCPLTANGFVRVLSQPLGNSVPVRPSQLIERLAVFCSSPEHTFWAANLSLTDDAIFRRSHVAGPRQVTDIYLLGLAKQMKGVLATFDRSIPIGAVVGATRSTLAIIGAGDDGPPRQVS